MARPLRVEYPGAFYHVMSRGNAGEAIFQTDGDRHQFLDYVERAVKRFSLVIHTYCLMANHYHLIVETPLANLSNAIQWLNVSYATYFNRVHERYGHLFQGRFKAILIDADEYLTHLSRYIHLNPLRADIVRRPQEFPWSSYPSFAGRRKGPDWLETDFLLSQFAPSTADAADRYRRFVEEFASHELPDPEAAAIGGVLGSKVFIAWLQHTVIKDMNHTGEIPQLKRVKPFVSLDAVLKATGDAFDCDTEDLKRKGSKNNQGRQAAIYLARELCGKTLHELGQSFGGVSGAAITMSCNKIAAAVDNDRALRVKIETIRKRIFNI